VKITHYLAGFILGANLVIVGNGGRASAGRERQACLSRLSRVDGRSTQAFVYSAAISPHRKLLQVVIGCNSLIGSFSDTFLGLKFQCPTTSLFHSCFHVPQPHFSIPASTSHNLTFKFSIPASASNWLTVWRQRYAPHSPFPIIVPTCHCCVCRSLILYS
jgi:hypothetical protein